MGPRTYIVRQMAKWMIPYICLMAILWVLYIGRAWSDQGIALSKAFKIVEKSGGVVHYQQLHYSEPAPIVTFIIPSKGRNTLNDTISSIYWQDDPRWEALIVFDGPQPQYDSSCPYRCDPRIKIYTTPKIGQQNFAASLRNYGMMKACTDWIAFVDDDDLLSTDYVTRLVEEIRMDSQLEAVIFRMSGFYSNALRILPHPEDSMFRKYNVGISFSIKRDLFKAGFWFQPSPTEDFDLLERIWEAKKRMVISPYITYYVRRVRPTGANVGKGLPRHYLHRT